MIFGNTSEFAIQVQCEPELVAPSAVWGRMCVWCQGVELGDINDSHCSLYPAVLDFQALEKNLQAQELWDDSFSNLRDEELFERLDWLYYGCDSNGHIAPDSRTDEQVATDARRFSKFNFLTNWGEQFDGYKAFIFARGDGVVRIAYRLPDYTKGIAHVPESKFTASIDELLSWFAEQQDRLGGGIFKR
jgi:hypothetical protein